MSSVLLTRPRSASESLARELERHGYVSVVEPLLIIEPLSTPRPGRADIGAVMITSANALEAGVDFTAFFGLPCFCVGSRSAEKARSAGFRDVRYAAGDGIELARLISGSLEKAAILHVSGKDIASGARDELARFGYEVIGWPVYAAHQVRELADKTVDLLKEGKIDAVTAFSVRTAQALVGLLTQNRLEACCEGLTAIGLSEAVADALRPLPWRQIATASAPTEDAMIECLKRIHPVSRG